ncbi:MAG: YihY/virulence factor BrkB family protein, partial [Myxococcales bacterium]|nr:YihY/virulence factor BrkB family protein [Myxococcales bacterium]
MAGRIWVEIGRKELALVAAGVAFYGLLALFPALAGVASLYGVWSTPTDVITLVHAARGVLPSALVSLLTEQLGSLTRTDDSTLTWSAALGLALSVWSANRGTKALFAGLNIVYDERERRSFVLLNAESIGVTVVGLVALTVALGALTVLPALDLVDRVPSGSLDALRYSALALGMLLALALVYAVGPDRRRPRWAWVSVGSVVATGLWLVGCAGFSLYVETFGSYNQTFGALAGVAVTLTWLWMTAWVVLFGAEVNAELEHETLADSTVGPDRPLGERGAWVADDVPEGVRRAAEGSD